MIRAPPTTHFRSRTEEIHAVHEIEMIKTRVTVNGLYLTVIYTHLYAHMRCTHEMHAGDLCDHVQKMKRCAS